MIISVQHRCFKLGMLLWVGFTPPASGAKEPSWPPEVRQRGYVVIPRSALPLTLHDYMPHPKEIGAPLRLKLAAGETGSAVIFVRALSKDITVQGHAKAFKSKGGYGIRNSYGAGSVSLRAAEDRTMRGSVNRPELLKFSNKLSLKANDGGQFWLTVEVPPDTPPGDYTGDVTLTAVGDDNPTKLPVVLTIRDLDLKEADVAFGTWDTLNSRGELPAPGPVYVLPGSDGIYLADQRRHGMNTAGVHVKAERRDKDGGYHITFNELDAKIRSIQRAGLCTRQPLVLLTWSDLKSTGGFGVLAGGEQAVMDIHRHGKKAGWPALLFTALDEPGPKVGRRYPTGLIEQVMSYYTPAREQGVRTVTAGPDPLTMGKYYDVWIQSMWRNDWPDQFREAREYDAEVWMYDCGFPGINPMLDRFYAGLWTWRTGVKGNMSWSYGWYVRINDSGLPESRTAWEGRREGVNDYRYLHTLEEAISDAQTAGREEDAEVKAAVRFLDKLRTRVPLDTYDDVPRGGHANQLTWEPVPDMTPENYNRIREQCAKHIIAIGQE